MNILKKLFGIGSGTAPSESINQSTRLNSSALVLSTPPALASSHLNDKVPKVIQQYRETYKGKSLEELNHLYFTIMEQLIVADKDGDINSTLLHAKASLGLLEPLIRYNKMEYGSFDIETIPALDKSLLYFSLLN